MLRKRTKQAIKRRKRKTRNNKLVRYLAIVAFIIGVILVGIALINWINVGEYNKNMNIKNELEMGLK